MPIDPTNLTAATAIDVTPPYSATFKSTVLAGSNPSLWFSYTPQSTDVVLGTWAFTSLASANKPTVRVWFGTALSLTRLTTLVDLNETAANVPYSVPMGAGTSTTYFFEVRNAGVDVAGVADLTFSTVAQPTQAVAAGDLMVSDETFGFPVVALETSAGGVKKHEVFSAGESVDIQADGTMLAEAIDFNGDTIGLQIWTSTFGLQLTVGLPVTFDEVYHIYASPLGGWWISGRDSTTTTTVVKMFSDGSFDPTTYTITHGSTTNPVGIAVNSDETILYYSRTGTANVAIQRWDLVNDIALADLVAGIANYQVMQDLLVLGDDTIVAGYKKTSVTRDSNALHYDTSGALLDTYAFGSANFINRLCRQSITTSTTFWIWLYPGNATSGVRDGSNRYVQVLVADGTLPNDFTVTFFERGVYSTAATATPTARFGPSFSCPMWIFPTSPIPPGDPVATTIRRERIFRHLSDEQQWIFYQWMQLDIEAGVGLSEGQGSDPQIILQWSDDGGHTWSNEHLLYAGKQGEYSRRAMLKQPLGRSRDRVFKVAMSDPVKWALLNAYFGAEKGSS